MYFVKETVYRLTENSRLQLKSDKQTNGSILVDTRDEEEEWLSLDESVGLLHALADMLGYRVERN